MAREVQILPEEGFRACMTEQVEPFLNARRTAYRIARDPANPIYTEFYEAEKPTAIAVISHGFSESAEKYLETVFYFLQAGCHVCIPDHFGHGRSAPVEREDPSLIYVDRFERYAEDLRAAAMKAKALWPGLPLVFFGHSMGGSIGAVLSGREADLFRGLILVAPMIQPLTYGVPWPLARLFARICCIFGQSKKYVIRQHPYRGREHFESATATSRARFDYYQDKRFENPCFQSKAASYGWLREAGRMYHCLMGKTCRHLTAPVLLFEAGQETFVSNRAEERFFAKLQKHHVDETPRRLIRAEDARHEIHASTPDVLAEFWRETLAFLDEVLA